jgi:hypothetical protein
MRALSTLVEKRKNHLGAPVFQIASDKESLARPSHKENNNRSLHHDIRVGCRSEEEASAFALQCARAALRRSGDSFDIHRKVACSWLSSVPGPLVHGRAETTAQTQFLPCTRGPGTGRAGEATEPQGRRWRLFFAFDTPLVVVMRRFDVRGTNHDEQN